MQFTNENGILTLFPSGKIETTNAESVQKDILSILESNPHTELKMDAGELTYVSSAGLRVILAIKKKEPSFTIDNCKEEVYDVFDMTGFTEMMTIHRAYRSLSVEGCEVIGEGANGKVYRINPDTIVKVYMNPDSLPDIHKERELAKRAFVLGVPTAISYDVVRIGEGYGSVFELLDARALNACVREEPENIDKYVKVNVDLLKIIHGTEVRPEDMPSERDVVIGWATFVKDYLPEDIGTKLLELVKAVPEDLHMMHGDYHVKNVMMQGDDALLIDMDTLCHGHPIFELASMFNAYVGFRMFYEEEMNPFLKLPTKDCLYFWRKSLALYLGTDDENRITEVENKAKLIGTVRLMRRLIRRNGLDTEEGRETIEKYKSIIIDLTKQIDTLLF